MRERKYPTPHQRIMRAYERGSGIRLSIDEVAELALDSAIEVCAANDDEAQAEQRREARKARRLAKNGREGQV